MSIDCKDPKTFLTNKECQSDDLKLYIESYKEYLNRMNNYCGNDDNSLSNPNCRKYITENRYIQNTEAQQTLIQKIPNLCKDNTNPELNNLCIKTYNVKPQIVIKEEARIAKGKEDTRNMYIGIGIGVLLAVGGGIMYKKRKEKK